MIWRFLSDDYDDVPGDGTNDGEETNVQTLPRIEREEREKSSG